MKQGLLFKLICGLAFLAALPAGRALFYEYWPAAAKKASPSVQTRLSESTREPGEIVIHYHERPPYYVTSGGAVRGLCADPVNLAFQKAEIPYRWQKTPARRQLLILKKNLGRECVIGWFMTPERKKIAKFTRPIYQDQPAAALARADNPFIVSGRPLAETLGDPRLVLLRKDSYSYGVFVDEQIESFKPRQETTTAENMSMLQMIHSGRADYFFIAREEARALLASTTLPPDQFKLVDFSDMPAGNRRYLLCCEKVEDEIIEKLNLALENGPGRVQDRPPSAGDGRPDEAR